MVKKIVIRNINTGEFLHNNLFRGFYLDDNIMTAIKCNSVEEAQRRIQKQDICRENALEVEEVEFR